MVSLTTRLSPFPRATVSPSALSSPEGPSSFLATREVGLRSLMLSFWMIATIPLINARNVILARRLTCYPPYWSVSSGWKTSLSPVVVRCPIILISLRLQDALMRLLSLRRRTWTSIAWRYAILAMIWRWLRFALNIQDWRSYVRLSRVACHVIRWWRKALNRLIILNVWSLSWKDVRIVLLTIPRLRAAICILFPWRMTVLICLLRWSYCLTL